MKGNGNAAALLSKEKILRYLVRKLDPTPILNMLLSAGGTGVLGFAAGYIAKKIVKIVFYIISILAALQIGFLAYLQYGLGWINITVNWTAIETSLSSAAAATFSNAMLFVQTASTATVLLGTGGIGLLYGLKKG